MASIEVEHVFNCMGNTGYTGIFNNIFSGKPKRWLKKNFSQCPIIFQAIVSVELFVEQVGVKSALVWFTIPTSLEFKCFVFDFYQIFH